jgi:hypothetical protein
MLKVWYILRDVLEGLLKTTHKKIEEIWEGLCCRLTSSCGKFSGWLCVCVASYIIVTQNSKWHILTKLDIQLMYFKITGLFLPIYAVFFWSKYLGFIFG